ncbi:hypothetical protein AXF42_Ash008677 [Apostasia shenzhenica]|uniref:Mitochondrial transcription termination factor family protein n=1 Tax=Apostasia shenzhenica TaxID=1088818 RepID=A0A2I0B226_9ASPA|nr:hypothetical protein AXF42_Ash008677 [Apostasia shenzhenica]
MLRFLFRIRPLRHLHDLNPITHRPWNLDLGVVYLLDSSSFSTATTLSMSASQKIASKRSKNADSVIALLSNHGFTSNQITSIASRVPALLSGNPDKCLKPKLNFLLSTGLTKADVVRLISIDPFILKTSLKKRLVPNFNLLKSILGSVHQVANALGRCTRLVRQNLENVLLPNMKTMQEHGVPRHRIVKLAIRYPRTFLQNTAKFSHSVAFVKEMGFDVLKWNFILGVCVVACLTSSTWERKLKLYQRLGWSEDDAISAFKKHPFCMVLSDDKIKKGMGFFVEKVKLELSFVAAHPNLLSLSLEKRVLPRCMVLDVLESKGLLQKKKGFAYCMQITEKQFLDRFVNKHECEVPLLLEAYHAKLDLAVFPS